MSSLYRFGRSCLLIVGLVSFALACGAQELAVPDNLVTEGVPGIRASLADAANRYTNFRSADFAGWHPTRREMLVLTRFQDTRQVHAVRMPGGARSQLTFFPDGIGNARYSPKGDGFFVFSKDVGGGEFYQFYRYDVADGQITLLTDGKSRNTGFVWSSSGGRIAYGSTRRTGKDVDIWAMNPADPKSDRLVAQLDGGGWQVLDWSPDDNRLLVQQEISANESYLWLMDASNGQKTLLTPRTAAKIAYSGGQFAKDGKSVYITTDKDSEFRRLAVINLASGQHTFLTSHLAWDVEEFDLAQDGSRVAFVTNEDGYGVLHMLDTKSGKEHVVAGLPKGVLGNVHWHRSSRDLAFEFNSASTNDDVYSLDVQSDKIERWTESETGGINTANFREPELIHWKSWDGHAISGFLYRPPAKFSGKRPVIINIHGGPEGQFRPYFLGRSMYYPNELGVAMIFPNVRGSSGYGKTFLSLDNGFLREGSYQDINTLLDWIQTQPDLDASRVMITGGSYGGFMTLAVATNYNDRICCSVDIVGPSNLVTFLQNTSGYRQDLRRVEYGDERDPKMREFLERIAPMNKTKNITKPLFVIAGQNDPRVPASESQQMVATVRKGGTPVWYLLAKDEGHGFGKKKNQDFQFFATLMFVKKYLLGEP